MNNLIKKVTGVALTAAVVLGSTGSALAVSFPFPDVPDERFHTYIQNLHTDGLIQGNDGNFEPERGTTRAEATKMVMGTQGIEEDLSCSGYGDMNTDHSLYSYVLTFRCLGLTSSAQETTYDADGEISRAEVADLLFNSMQHNGMDVDFAFDSNFPDVPEDHVYYRQITFLTKIKTLDTKEPVFKGFGDGEFKPDRPITRQELAKVVDLARRPTV